MVKFAKFVQRILGRIFTVFQGVSSAWLFILMVLISIDVIGRVLFNTPFKGTPELVSFSIIIIAFLEVPYVFWAGGLVRSTVLYDKVGPTGKDIIDLIAAVIGIVVFSMLIKSSLNDFIKAIRVREFEGEGALRIATSPARAFLILGSGFMILQMILNVCKKAFSIYKRVSGRTAA
ncbi:TRAP transporter small permease [Treponema primitia]|uniref:TRAP transporter small permease subunit n=1 Tax=Treponema primitia TaxID=88058 RepID=UPI00398036AB